MIILYHNQRKRSKADAHLSVFTAGAMLPHSPTLPGGSHAPALQAGSVRRDIDIAAGGIDMQQCVARP